MVPCLVLGDSIAVGTAAALPVCHAEAVVGISSSAWVHRFGARTEANLVVISLGANDGAAHRTKDTISALRSTVRACRVVWLLPAYPALAREAIMVVAANYGDRIVDTAPYAPPGGLHPSGRGYAAVAYQAENTMQDTAQRHSDGHRSPGPGSVLMRLSRVASCGLLAPHGTAARVSHHINHHRVRRASNSFQYKFAPGMPTRGG
jgi:hypothetical protein